MLRMAKLCNILTKVFSETRKLKALTSKHKHKKA